jgi:hypothetical protein
VSFVAWHRPWRDKLRRYLLVSVGTIFRTDTAAERNGRGHAATREEFNTAGGTRRVSVETRN